MDKNKDIFSQKLRQLRHEMGLTQKEMAKKVFLSRCCITNYERGFRYPDIQTLRFIAERLGVDIGYFFA